MNIATYNMLKGGTERSHWMRLIEDHDVDVLLAQESFSPSEHLSGEFRSRRSHGSVWNPAGTNRWGSGIFVRSARLRPFAVPGFEGWVTGAEMTGSRFARSNRDRIVIFSVHVPHGPGSYAGQTNRVLDEISRIAAGRQIVIGGDFNISILPVSGFKRPVSKRNLAIQTRLAEEFGLVNCWQHANPGRLPAQTLRWTGNRETPYHCDGIFVPKLWVHRLSRCEVLSSHEWDRLSDHNPVIARFR